MSQTQKEKPAGIAILPYQQAVFNKIIRLLFKHNIKIIHMLVKKSNHMVISVKDKLGLKFTGIYCVPFEYSKVYVGQTGQTTETKCKEHLRHTCLGQSEKSTVAEYKFETGHEIKFPSNMDKALRFMDCIITNIVKIRLHPRNINSDRGLSLSWSWYPVAKMIKQHREEPIQR
jgi:hypothetical protein